ncbi:SIS domain-containing protein [Actinomadura geliboluensis]|uniref:SIS domain-containing protein n=1 Tax=Actinomadura geliboluensis TaxID=882440 RepID=UPI0037212979
MAAITLDVLDRQAAALEPDLARLAATVPGALATELPASACRGVQEVVMTGNGDSLHACLAATLAFGNRAAPLRCTALGALPFTLYHAPANTDPTPVPSRLLIAVSASGRTPQVLDALTRARAAGMPTMAITGTAGSPLAQAAHHRLVVPLPDSERSPGVRTFQASLVALTLTAMHLAEQIHLPGQRPEPARAGAAEVAALTGAVGAAAHQASTRGRAAAELIASAPTAMILGTGPGYGVARFTAAKLAEIAGVPAAAVDIEEWQHVEYHTHPIDMPTVVVAPPGRALGAAQGAAAAAVKQGRRLVWIGNPDHAPPQAHAVIAVHATCPEELTPIPYSACAGPLARHVASILRRLPFLNRT